MSELRAELEYWYADESIRELVDKETLEVMLRSITSLKPTDIDYNLMAKVIKTMGFIMWDYMSQNGRTQVEWVVEAVEEARDDLERCDGLAAAYGVVRRHIPVNRQEENTENHILQGSLSKQVEEQVMEWTEQMGLAVVYKIVGFVVYTVVNLLTEMCQNWR